MWFHSCAGVHIQPSFEVCNERMRFFGEVNTWLPPAKINLIDYIFQTVATIRILFECAVAKQARKRTEPIFRFTFGLFPGREI